MEIYKPENFPGNRYLRAWILFKRVYDILIKVRNNELKEYGSNIEQAGVLKVIQSLGVNATPNEIASVRFRRPHTISVLLRSMERSGLVARTKDDHRKNVIRISLTDNGKEASQKLKKSRAIKEILETALSQAEIKQLSTYMWLLCSEAEHNYAANFKISNPKSFGALETPDIDLKLALKGTQEIIARVHDVVNIIDRETNTHGTEWFRFLNENQSVSVIDTFSPKNVGLLNDYLEIIGRQTRLMLGAKHQWKFKPPESLNITKDPVPIIWRNMGRAHDIIMRIRSHELLNRGFSVELSSVLGAIKALGNEATAGGIARYRFRRSSTISMLLDKLENQGLIKRSNKPIKGKRNVVKLTEKGERILGLAVQGESLIPIFSFFSQKDLAQLFVYLKAIRDQALEKYSNIITKSITRDY